MSAFQFKWQCSLMLVNVFTDEGGYLFQALPLWYPTLVQHWQSLL